MQRIGLVDADAVPALIGPVTNWSMRSLGMDDIRAAAAGAAFVVFLLGIHAPVGHAMPRTQNPGQAPTLRGDPQELAALPFRAASIAVASPQTLGRRNYAREATTSTLQGNASEPSQTETGKYSLE